MRLSRYNLFMELAKVVARRGTCPRLCVGAVVVINNRPVSIGYNGSEPGQPHCTEVGCLTAGEVSCVRTLHAEANAIDYIPPSLAWDNAELYVTHSPCQTCTEKIIESNINKVYFETPYKFTTPIIRLLDCDIEVHRIMPNGYMIDGSDGELHEIR